MANHFSSRYQNKLTLSILVFLGCLFFLPPTDPDLGWQLRCGEQIWQTGKVCSVNTFSVLLPDYASAYTATLYQGILYPFYKILGLNGLSLLNSLIVSASFYFLFKINGQKNLRIIFLPLAIFLSWTVFGFGIRSQLTSLLYFCLLLWLFEKSQENYKCFYYTPLVLFLWANSHGSFIIGLIMIAAFGVSKLKYFVRSAVVGIISIIATLINPYGVRIYTEAWNHLYRVKLNTLIAEWVPPLPLYQLVVYLFLFLGIYLLFKYKKQSLSLFKLLLLISFAYLALKARRNLSYFFIFSAYLTTTIPYQLTMRKEKLLNSLALLVGIFIFTYGFFYQFPKTLMANHNWASFCRAGQVEYPYRAVEFLRQQTPGNIFNRYEWGGYLIWQLPKNKVFVDGRMPAWITPSGKSPYTIFLETYLPSPGWQETLKQYNISWILINPYGYLDAVLEPDPGKYGWQEVYRDPVAVVYKNINNQ